jgi:signal transduction histidine kinase
MDDKRPGRALRLVLTAGFGGLLALSAVAGIEALRTLQSIHTEEQAARAAFLARTQALLQFREGLDAWGTGVQEYFLSVPADGNSDAAERIGKVVVQIRTALDAWPRDRDPEEEQLLAVLRDVLGDQNRAVTQALAEDHFGDAARMSRYLHDEVLPRHVRVIETTEKIAIWDNRHFSGMDAQLFDRFSALRSRLARLLVVMLGSGFVLAIASIVYILGQDREARVRYAELMESRTRLSDLSARLLEAQEEERRSISRELHDEVGQSLGALLVDVGSLASSIPAEDVGARERLSRVKALAEGTVNSVRNIALLLRPSMLDDLGLVAALEWLAREVSRRGEMEVEVEARGVSDHLPEEYRVCVYRVVQEALNNAQRHSGGRNARVRVEQSASEIAITVRDDGHGFDPKRTRGLGLLGMEERVARLKGTLRVESAPGVGTVIDVRLPMTEEAD